MDNGTFHTGEQQHSSAIRLMELAILICVLAALILFLAPEKKKKKKTNCTLIVAVGFACAFVFLQSLARAMAQQRADKTNNSA